MPCWASPVNGKVRENLKWFVTFIIGGGIFEGYQLFFFSPLFFLAYISSKKKLVDYISKYKNN